MEPSQDKQPNLSRETQPQTPELDISSYESAFTRLVEVYPDLPSFIDEVKSYQPISNDSISRRSYDIASYVGSGEAKDVFKFHDLAVKIMRPQNYAQHIPGAFGGYLDQVTPLIAGQDIPHLEQLVATDAKNDALITTFTPGSALQTIPTRKLFSMSQSHLEELATTLHTMRKENLHPHNIGGVLYDPATGFNFVDYELADAQGGYRNDEQMTAAEGLLELVLSQPHEGKNLPLYERLQLEAYHMGLLSLENGLRHFSAPRSLAKSIIMKRYDKAMRRATNEQVE